MKLHHNAKIELHYLMAEKSVGFQHTPNQLRLAKTSAVREDRRNGKAITLNYINQGA